MTTLTALTPSEIIEQARKLLIAIRAPKPPADRVREMAAFMSLMFDLGLAINRNPTIHKAPEVEAFQTELCSQIVYLLSDIQLFVSRTEDQLYGSWDGDEWLQVCKRRSSLSFMMELCGNVIWSELLEEDPGDLDELIKEKGEHEGYLTPEEIPAGIPSSHWWWWYPESPPQQTLSN